MASRCRERKCACLGKLGKRTIQLGTLKERGDKSSCRVSSCLFLRDLLTLFFFTVMNEIIADILLKYERLKEKGSATILLTMSEFEELLLHIEDEEA